MEANISMRQEQDEATMLRAKVGRTYDRARFEVVTGIVVELEHKDHDQVMITLLVPSYCIHKPAYTSQRNKHTRDVEL